MIKCGHCGEGHGSVAAVRACSTASVLVKDRGESASLPLPTAEDEARWTAEIQAAEAEEERRRTEQKLDAQWFDMRTPAERDSGDSLRAGLERIRELLDERVVEERYGSHLRIWVDAGEVTWRGVVTAIARLESMDVKGKGSPVTRDGIYRTADGAIWKVQWNRAGGDGKRLYGKRWDSDAHVYRYTPNALKRITAEERLTKDQVAALGRDASGPLYGYCGKCGLELTDDASIAAGIGPVCASKKDYWN